MFLVYGVYREWYLLLHKSRQFQVSVRFLNLVSTVVLEDLSLITEKGDVRPYELNIYIGYMLIMSLFIIFNPLFYL